MRVLDLFSGIGGFSLGLERAGFETVAFCEQDKFCQKLLKKHWPNVPIHPDIRRMNHGRLEADVIAAGFPCTDVSSAGQRAGIEGKHTGLWRECFRIICGVRPRYIVLENAPGLLVRGMADVLGDLAGLGYDAEWHIITAADVGLPHLRARVWIIAYPRRIGNQLPKGLLRAGWERAVNSVGGQAQSDVCRVADGIPNQSHRLRALGNAVVPQIPELIGRAILETQRP